MVLAGVMPYTERMIIQSSDIYNPLSARSLLKREGGTYDLEQAAEQIIDRLAKFPNTQLVKTQNEGGIGSILINPQVVDLASMAVVDIGAQFIIPVQDYDDAAGIKAALPELLSLLEDKMVELPRGQRLEVVLGVSGQRPRSRINLDMAGQADVAPGTTFSRSP